MKKFTIGDLVVSKTAGRAMAKDDNGKITNQWVSFSDSTIGVIVGIAKDGVTGYGIKNRLQTIYRVKYKEGVIDLPDSQVVSFDNPDDSSISTKMARSIDRHVSVKEVSLENEPEY